VINSQGQLAWQSASLRNVWRVSGGDVLGNGRPQVITTSVLGQVHVFSHDGAERRDIRPEFYAVMVRAGRVSGIPGADTIIAMGHSSGITAVAAFSGNGSRHWGQQLPGPVYAAWLARSKPWLAVSVSDGSVYVLDALNGAVIGGARYASPIVDVGWSASQANGSPLLLVSGGGSLKAYRVTTSE
jgi:hypothetical protein